MLYPRFYLTWKWTEDGTMWGYSDSWLNIGPKSLCSSKKETIRELSHMEHEHWRQYIPHNCYEYANEQHVMGICITDCGLCGTSISVSCEGYIPSKESLTEEDIACG